ARSSSKRGTPTRVATSNATPKVTLGSPPSTLSRVLVLMPARSASSRTVQRRSTRASLTWEPSSSASCRTVREYARVRFGIVAIDHNVSWLAGSLSIQHGAPHPLGREHLQGRRAPRLSEQEADAVGDSPVYYSRRATYWRWPAKCLPPAIGRVRQRRLLLEALRRRRRRLSRRSRADAHR